MSNQLPFKLSEIRFDFDLANTNFEIDAIQDQILQYYLQTDMKFRRAYNIDFTMHFFKMIMDKARLKQPITLSVSGQTRGGKCCHSEVVILLSDGTWKKAKDIKIGDEIISPQKDGSHVFAKVKNVTLFDSETYDVHEWNRKEKQYLYSCTPNHLIPVFHCQSKRINGNQNKRKREWIIDEYTSEELFNQERNTLKCNNLGMTSFLIDKFKDRINCEIEPYTLGVYIGDGSFGRYGYSKQLAIHNSKSEIMEYISQFYPVMSINSRKGKTIESIKRYSYSVTGELSKLLEKYGLFNKKSGDKFIPKEALLSDSEYRKKLLAGLIDTDGYVRKNGSCSICTKSKQLAEDIKNLVYSLGGWARINPIKKSINSINFTGYYFNISFYLGDLKLPIKVNYKRRTADFWYKSSNRFSLEVKKGKFRQVVGIEIDSPSKWMIIDGWNITHNSSAMITVCMIHMALYGKIFTPEYICGNAIEYLEKLKDMPEEKTRNSIFLIDEEKQGIFNLGSVSKKMRLADVQNITAKYNVSNIMICPNKVSNSDALYSIRIFGKAVDKSNPTLPDGSPNYSKPNLVRCMLYNLQGGDKSNAFPLGMLYIPNFMDIFPKDYVEPFNHEYLKIKDEWVMSELRGSDDVLSEMRLKLAQNFAKDENCMSLKKKERFSYLSVKLGSGYTQSEINDIVNLTSLIEKGVLPADNIKDG